MLGISLVVQWLRLHLPMQGTGVQSPGALQPKNQNIKQKQYCNKFNRAFKKKKENSGKKSEPEQREAKGKKTPE